MPLAEFLDPLAGLLQHIHGHGDDQPHVRRVIEALRKETDENIRVELDFRLLEEKKEIALLLSAYLAGEAKHGLLHQQSLHELEVGIKFRETRQIYVNLGNR